ncbi:MULTISPECIES: GNAT family N-acetyltransferase [Emticicia]|uniref:GNAT family N-acetyltransferase n=1 Tax=Emticicia TaxID=312278 RepID=UPI0007D8BB00|nr:MULTISPECIES: GNAT family N-acetyltransferase [Emticicia]
MDIFLRKATQKDADLTFEIEQDAYKEYSEELYSTEIESHRKYFDSAFIQMVEYKNQTIGYLEVEEKNHSFEIINIQIQKDFQNLGLGSRIIKKVIEEGEQKSKGIELQVLKNNPKAKRFYENSGFQVYFETEFEYKMKFSHANRILRNKVD